MPHDFSSDFNSFARLYNLYFAPVFCRVTIPIIEKLLLKNLKPGNRILDICCGTGHMTNELLVRGFSVTGIDSSEEMLRFARINAPQADLILGDACTIKLATRYHAAISTFCSFNHITADGDLARILKRACEALLKGGILMFDLNTEHGLSLNWKDYMLVEEEHVCLARVTYAREHRIARADITLFNIDKSSEIHDYWLRHDFAMYQRYYTEREVMRALDEAGFSVQMVLNAERDLGIANGDGILFYLCVKNCR